MNLVSGTGLLSTCSPLNRLIQVSAVLILSVHLAGAVTKTWTGAVSTNWNTSGNWSPSGVPSAGDDIIIGSATNQPTRTGNLTIGNWNTGSLTVTDSAVLTVTGDITITGGNGVSGLILSDGGVLNHTGTDFSLPFVSTVCIAIDGGKLITNAEDFLLTGKMTMSSGEFVAKDGFAVASGKEFNATGGIIRITGLFELKSSNSSFYAGSDSLIVTGRMILGSSCNFYGGSAKIVITRVTNANNTNNQISGNWYTQNANVTFNPYIPLGGRLTSISSSGAVFHVNQGTVQFNDSVYIGSNASLDGDSGTVTFTRSLVVSGDGTINNDIGEMNFEGNATFTSSGTFNTGSGEINVGGDVAFSSNGVINNTSATINITGDAVFHNSGTLNAGSGEISVGGDVTFEGNGGTINAGTATISVGGDFNNLGTFNCDSSTVILSGENSQVISTDVTFFNLQIQTQGTLEANGNVTVLNNGVIGTQTEISIPNNNDQFEVNGDLVDSSGSLAVATNKPFVVAVEVVNNTRIIVLFNEQVTQSSAENSANSSWTGRTISSRSLIDTNKLQIDFTPAITYNTEYLLVFQNITNLRNPPGTMSPNHEKRFTWSLPSAPSNQLSNIQVSAASDTSITITWTRGNGASALIVARMGAAVSDTASNGNDYNANPVFGQGDQLGNAFVVYKGNGTSATITGLEPNRTYYFSGFERNGNGAAASYLNSSPPSASRHTNVRVDVQVFLEGPYNGSKMQPTLNPYLPLSQVYSGAPWNYGGTESVATIPNDSIVDWVLVELRLANSSAQAGQETVVGRRAGFLLSNGSIVDTNGYSPLYIATSSPGRYYMVVYHRTHLPVQSSDSLERSGTVFVYNFTQAAGMAYGNNSTGELAQDLYGLHAGRVAGNTSNVIGLSDAVAAWNNRNQAGYHACDVNMDGVVDALDRSLIWNNRGLGSNVVE